MTAPLVPPPSPRRPAGRSFQWSATLGLALAAALVQGCGLHRALTGQAPAPAPAPATAAATTPATTQEGSLTVRSGLPPRAGDVPAGAAMPPVPPRPPLQAETETAAPEAVTTTTTTTVAEAPAMPAAPAMPGAGAGMDTGMGGLVAGSVRPQTATGAFTGGRGGCEALAATTLARENRLDDATPPAELLALGTMHLELARCARGAGDPALARARARQAAVLLARAVAGEIDTGNLAGLADTRSQLGHAAYEAGEYPEARRLLRDAIARYSALGRPLEVKRDLRLLAVLGPGAGAGP